MQSLKDSLVQKIEQTSPNGFLLNFEQSEYKVNLQQMHGSHAQGSLNNVFHAYFVGNKIWFKQFLVRTIQWCQTSINLKTESDWQPRAVSWIYETYAGATWLYTGQDDVAIWKACLEYTNLWFFTEKNPTDFSKTKAKGIETNLFYTYLQRCLFAKEYKLGIDVYEYFKGKKEVKLTSKTGLVTLMYAILRHYEYGEFDKARLNKVCRQILGKELKYVYCKIHTLLTTYSSLKWTPIPI